MSKRTKALQISADTKRKVFSRDGERCVWCGSIYGRPEAHYISRAQGGLGIEENLLTLCPDCHRAYDQSTDRPYMADWFCQYLKEKYPGWNERNLVYRKET